MFEPGGPVEVLLGDQLQLRRGDLHLDGTLANRSGNAASLLADTAAVQGELLGAPGWAQRAADDMAAIVHHECRLAAGEVLAGLVADLEVRNRVGASNSSIPPARATIEDLSAGSGDDTLTRAFAKVFAVDTPWPNRPEAAGLAENQPRIDAVAAAIDPATEKALATVVEAMARAEKWRLAALQAWYPDEVDFGELERFFSTASLPPLRVRSFDHAAMAQAGAALALAVERLEVHLAGHPLPSDLDATIDTPLGQVVLRGATTDDVHALAAPALVVDQGGNDMYRGVIAAPAMASVPLSVLIDLAGNDQYEAAQAQATQGAGVLSFGFLLDRAGDDRYEATGVAQGTGLLGVGALYDRAGNDSYLATQSAQGAGHSGLGLAVDLSGNDTWRITTMGQGYGSPRGAGLLLDAGGDDLFEANDTDITNPSPQTAQHNTSLAQGVGYGQRTGNRSTSLSGGTGLLVDLSGRDRYSCGVFCQGSGYFFGHGVLYDADGDDTYRGVWYVQGAAAHFALGTFIDVDGADVYETVMASSRGLGHDESAGFFVDGGGDDRYRVARLSHGATSNVGYGFFVDAGGSDVYDTVGLPEPGRYGQAVIDGDFANYHGYGQARAVGLFLDLGGADRYIDAPSEVTNGATWELEGAASYKLGVTGPPDEQVGVGRDVP